MAQRGGVVVSGFVVPLRIIIVAVTVLSAVACGLAGSSQGDAMPGTTSTIARSSATSALSTASTSADGLLLRGDGLSDIDFGASQQGTLDRLTEVLGSPGNIATIATPPSPGLGPECANRTTAFWLRMGMSVTFRHGKFDGWEVTGTQPATAGGTKVGATLEAVRKEFRSLHLVESRSLPVGADRSPKTGFVIDGLARGRLGGAADGPADRDMIRLLWGGVDCGSR